MEITIITYMQTQLTLQSWPAQDMPNIEIPLAQQWLTILYQDYLLIGISMDQYWAKYILI